MAGTMQRYDELYLFRRGRTFYFRFRIPQQFVETLGIHEIRRSLRTSDPKLARRRCRRMSVALSKLITWLEGMAEPTKSETVRIARQYLERELKANEVGTITPFEDDLRAGEYQVACGYGRSPLVLK